MKTTAYLFTGCLLLAAQTGFPQRQAYVLHVISHSRHLPLTLMLAQDARSVYHFTDSSITLTDSIDHPGIVTLLIDYDGTAGVRYRYPVYLMPGELFVQVNQDSDDREYVDGPVLSHDF